MGFLDLFRSKPGLAIGDCFSRSLSRAGDFPVSLSGRLPDGRKIPLCRIHNAGREFSIEALDDAFPIHLDGKELKKETLLEPNRNYGLSLSNHLIVIRLARRTESIGSSFMEGEWDIAPADDRTERATLANGEISARSLRRRYPDPENLLAFPAQDEACFRLQDLIQALPDGTERNAESATHASPPIAPTDALRPETPDFGLSLDEGDSESRACPLCWKTFAPGDALNIASHDSLTGDPILGPHAKLRFAATRFNAIGQAIDSAGAPAIDLACPHCRGRLPPSFFGHRQLIFSLVGAPSSGKSYYLSVLLKQLPEQLIRHFRLNLQDGDPSGNAQLNEMKNRLFSATSPEDAFISKTDFEGVMYQRLHRHGKLVPLPRPFVYYLQSLESPEQRASLVFYDNAGEHFKPGISLEDSPGALHVAASSALMFLFDPTTHPTLRKLLRRKRDPQLRTQTTDEQDTILAELGVRVKKMRALESHERVDTPLALLVGKFDLWRSLLPENAIAIPQGRLLTAEEIEDNSRLTRAFLSEHCPTVVANAESISNTVRYFPVSSLGHSPQELLEGPLKGRLAPNPKRLAPILATSPLLWILPQVAPNLLASPES
ncbi:hypothetical protein [Pelagicoccus sp. SDUM812003]|uniref:hypothetical protein n=1 Tax=Pelagicoccus sp. SDUM812003 TaxID=3041267 RepID=UPI00280F99F4|nr:hypothetical protein [Pelagicoccus sp. SDUM812003]MDQ8205682.1 hypothetical protein [Pelagicoccus sp. SDUM812003]